MGFDLFEKISTEKRLESKEQNQASMAPLSRAADPVGPFQSKPRGQISQSYDTPLTRVQPNKATSNCDLDDVGLRDSPLLRAMRVNLTPSPSPPPAAALPQFRSDSSPGILSQDDAVLVSFMDAEKRPEVADPAGVQPLASDGEEEEQPVEAEISIPPLAVSEEFSAKEIEDFERLNLNKQKEGKIGYLNHEVPLSPRHELWLEVKKRKQNEGSSTSSLSGFQDTMQEDARRQHPETSYDKTGKQVNRAPALSPKLGAASNKTRLRIETKEHQFTPQRYSV